MDSTEEWRHVGERIRQTREAKDLTQEQLLSKMEGKKKISPATLSIIENGGRKPRTATLQKIAEALGVRFEDLFPAQPEPAQPEPAQPSVSPPPSVKDIRDILLRYEPLRGLDQAVDKILEQIQLWSVYYGRARPQDPL